MAVLVSVVKTMICFVEYNFHDFLQACLIEGIGHSVDRHMYFGVKAEPAESFQTWYVMGKPWQGIVLNKIAQLVKFSLEIS